MSSLKGGHTMAREATMLMFFVVVLLAVVALAKRPTLGNAVRLALALD